MPRNSLPPPRLSDLPWMTPWYGPKALAQTGIRAMTSQVISGYADQRILQAAIDNIQAPDLVARYDYSSLRTPPDNLRKLELDANGALWIDYMADTGDGFDSTFSMASLLAQQQIEVDDRGEKLALPQGQILFLGGDQAYPYASDKEYRDRFLQAFEMTHWHEDPAKPKPRRRLFVLPGNHDWYDGLDAFDRLFCGLRDRYSIGRAIGQWVCHQHRSYWAVHLPHNWWIWGLDIQLNQNIDIGQIQYFHAMADAIESAPNDTKIILCIPTPSWHTGHEAQTTLAYSTNLVRILNLAIDKGKVCAVLSGDWHHYSRYFSSEHKLNLITSGGGGAYLAPTHELPNRIMVPWRSSTGVKPEMLPFVLSGSPTTSDEDVKNASRQPRPESVYPSKRSSRWLSWQILLFPIYNPTFCIALGTFYWVLWWFYTSTYVPWTRELGELIPNLVSKAQSVSGSSFQVPMDGILSAGKWLGWYEQLRLPWSVARWQPFFAFFALGIFGLIWAFLAGSKRPVLRFVESVAFWLLHVYAMAGLSQAILSFGPYVLPKAVSDLGWNVAWYSIAMLLLASGVAGTLCGIYLFIGHRVFKTHIDNGFSAIRIAGYKNFLRMRITKDELTIFPIGLKRVPHRAMSMWGMAGWRQPTDREIASGITAAYVSRRGLKPHLIERPIVIRASDIVDLDPVAAKPRPVAARPPELAVTPAAGTAANPATPRSVLPTSEPFT